MGYRPGTHLTVPSRGMSDVVGRSVPEPRRAPEPRTPARAAAAVPADPTRAEALSRIAAKVSGRRDLASLFDDIIDEAFGLFGVDRAGLWVYDAAGERPL